MHAVQASGELILERGEGCHLWDDQGNRYVDSTAGLWYANVGYGRAEIADAAAAQMRKLHAYSHYGDVSSRPTTDLADRISAIAPMDDAAVFFTSGGGESIETVVKLVRRYWSLVDQPDRTVIISRERAYHGLAGYGTSIVGTEAFKVGVGPLAGGTARVAWDSAEALEATILELGAGARRRVLLRADHRRRRRPAPARRLPAGGAGDLPRARRPLRRRRGDLRLRPRRRLVRLQPRRPRARRGHVREGDHVRLRAARRRHRRQARSRSRSGARGAAGVWRHGYTYSGHASAAAAAHANLDIIEREGLVARGLELETEIPDALAPLARPRARERDPRRASAPSRRSRSIPALLADDPGLTDRVTLKARDHGVLTRTLVGGGLQISPPLVITRAELDEVASGLRGALDDVAAAR